MTWPALDQWQAGEPSPGGRHETTRDFRDTAHLVSFFPLQTGTIVFLLQPALLISLRPSLSNDRGELWGDEPDTMSVLLPYEAAVDLLLGDPHTPHPLFSLSSLNRPTRGCYFRMMSAPKKRHMAKTLPTAGCYCRMHKSTCYS